MGLIIKNNMASKNNQVLNVSSTRSRTFVYNKSGVDISINLRTDVKSELQAGLEIGERFVKDVTEELKNFKKNDA